MEKWPRHKFYINAKGESLKESSRTSQYYLLCGAWSIICIWGWGFPFSFLLTIMTILIQRMATLLTENDYKLIVAHFQAIHNNDSSPPIYFFIKKARLQHGQLN